MESVGKDDSTIDEDTSNGHWKNTDLPEVKRWSSYSKT